MSTTLFLYRDQGRHHSTHYYDNYKQTDCPMQSMEHLNDAKAVSKLSLANQSLDFFIGGAGLRD